VNPSEIKSYKDKIFEEEFYPHVDALYNFAYYLTYDEEDSNDLVQETYLKAYRFANSYEKGTNAKAWLFKILKNAFINDYRKKSKRPHRVDYEDIVSYHDSEDSNFDAKLDMRQDVFKGMIGKEVADAVMSLPVDFKAIILLCDVEGFTYEEIARIFDIPIGTVRSRLNRARNMLKEVLVEYAKKMGYQVKR